ncbi:protein of unknown function [Caballeronia sp. S22]
MRWSDSIERPSSQRYIETSFAKELLMRKLTAALIVSLIGLIALSVSTTAAACDGTSGSGYSNPK